MDIERTIEFILEHEARVEATLAKMADDAAQRAAEADKRMDRMEAYMRRAVRLGIREARGERRKRRELDDKMTQLAASQLLTDEKVRDLSQTVKEFIASMRRGGNGHPPG